MALIDDLRSLLKREFPDASIKLSRSAGGRVDGTLIWDGFDGKAQIDRQTLLRQVINSLPAEAQVNVSFILTVTPDEMASMTKA